MVIEELRNYENQWVALLEPDKKVVAAGDDAAEVKRDAEQKGYTNVILMWVPPFDAYYVPAS